MRVLLLSEGTYDLMRDVLDATLDGQEILRRFDEPRRLPSDRVTLEIVRSARSAPDAVPELVAAAVERRDAGRAVADETREEVERLMFHFSDAGVAPSVLTRWFGYSSSRLFQLLDKRATAA